ncbi:MAG: hypothetical protein HY717_17445 [Planctomycetes bacterium]|nr:hypothetical protein [Planctomycetota bacterium]
MATGPIIYRTSTFTHLSSLQNHIRRSNDRILQNEKELATGFRVNVPSDDPLAATRILAYRRQIEQSSQYARSASLANAELEAADGAMAGITEILLRAQEIYQQQVNPLSTETNASAAVETEQLIEQAIGLANSKFGGKYLFGGRDGREAPARAVGDYVQFNGSENSSSVAIFPGLTIERDISGAEAFGGLSSEILGRVDLNPQVTAATKLVDLDGGNGVRLGSIRIDDGLGTQVILDLSGAENVGDLINLINDDGTVAASINTAGNGIQLALSGGDLTVSEVNGGNTAKDLGLLATSAGATLEGDDLNPRLRLTTPVSDLLGGSGIDLSGLTIANGGSAKTVSFAGASTLEDLLNAIDLAGIQVKASINGAGDGIDLRSTLSGARMTVAENGGASAAELGLLLAFADLGLEQLNNGLGVQSIDGNDFRITLQDGTAIDIDISGAETVQDVIDLINNSADNPGTLTASVVSGQNQIQLDDSSGGSGDLSVTPLNGSFAAAHLGIQKTAANPTAAITGDDLSPAGHQASSVFNTLILLRQALSENNSVKLERLGSMIEESRDRLLKARAEVGQRANRIELTRNRLEDQKLRFEALLAEDREVDLSEAVTEFEKQRNVLEASYAVTARILSLSLLDFLS